MIACLLIGSAVLIGIVVVQLCQNKVADSGNDARRRAPHNMGGPVISSINTDDSDNEATLYGAVSNKSGEGVSGAWICAIEFETGTGEDASHDPRCTTSGKNGAYELAGLPPARYILSAGAKGYIPVGYANRSRSRASQSSEIALDSGALIRGIDFILRQRGAAVFGVVYDIEGGPVEGAVVSASPEGRVGPQAFGRTDSDGRFTLWVEPPYARLHAIADGYASRGLAVGVPGTFVTIKLIPESVIVGNVIWNDSGEPLAGARVTVPGHAAITQSDGQFRLNELNPGGYKLTVQGDECIGFSDEIVHVGFAETSEPVTIRAHRAVAVSGMVLIEGEKPCADAAVRLHPRGNPHGPPNLGRTTVEGRVKIGGLLPGVYDVFVNCPGHLSRQPYPELVVAERSIAGVTWEVAIGATIRGFVHDTAGSPLEGATVSARRIQHLSDDAPLFVRAPSTGVDGEFELAGLLGGSYEVHASHPSFPRGEPVPIDVPSHDEIELVLAAGGTIRGHLRDESGRPQSGARMELDEAIFDRATLTDDDGAFLIAGVPSGTHHLLVRQSDGSRPRIVTNSASAEAGARVTVEAGQTIAVEVVIESHSGNIRGRVLREGHQRAAGVLVNALRQSESSGFRTASGVASSDSIVTDEEGRFRFDGLAEKGSYRIVAGDGTYEGTAAEVAPGASVEIELHETGALEGVVASALGSHPERFEVSVVNREKLISSTDSFFRTNGRWRLSRLPSGRYLITISSPTSSASAIVELAEGETQADIQITLP